MKRAVLLAIATILLALPPLQADVPLPADLVVTPLSANWAHKYGTVDAGLSDDSLLGEGAAHGWRTVDLDTLQRIEKTEPGSRHWFRRRLPDIPYRNPVLLLPPLPFAMEVYMGGTLIYDQGVMHPARVNQFNFLHPVIVPLPADYRGRVVLIALYSDHDIQMGLSDVVFLTDYAAALRAYAHLRLPNLILGWLFLFIGLFAWTVFVRRWGRRNTATFAFGFFSIAVGLLIAFIDGGLFVENYPLRYHLGFFGFFLFPVGLFAFLEQVLKTAYSGLLRVAWKMHLAFAVIVYATDILGLFPMYSAMHVFFLMLVVTTFVSVGIGLQAAVRGDGEARLFIAGVTILAILGVYDIAAVFGVIPDIGGLFKIGVFVLMLFLIILLERRFASGAERLQVYSHELEHKSVELLEANRHLELRRANLEKEIADRTRDLADKNVALQAALTELQATQDQLVMREKMAAMGNLVAGVAHEINTPIGAVTNAADVMRRCVESLTAAFDGSRTMADLRDDPDVRKCMDLLENNNRLTVDAGRRIARIVRSLKNFARLDEAEYQRVDLHEGLDSTLVLVHHELKHGVTIERQYGDLPPVYCYPNQINQVFMNLFVNAAHAMERRGVLRIETGVSGSWAEIRVSDTGRGIPPEHLDRIFDSGFSTKGDRGTGLGLAICRDIVDRHGGDLSVASTPGQGSTFTVRLPLRPAGANGGGGPKGGRAEERGNGIASQPPGTEIQ